ncbi:MAG: GDP-mannose 4,6-dehydratase [Anaerolineae bacterium]|nr:GDP-mannose 4,6-dehydratase [Anaerolineae bacterium]
MDRSLPLRALVTGAGGFVGRHLCGYFLENTDWELFGTIYPQPAVIELPQARLQLEVIDLRDPNAVQGLVRQFQPDYVFHLAAQSSVHTSFSGPWHTLENNIHAQFNVLEALRQACCEARVVVVGSNEEYGAPMPDELPQTENSPLRPTNPYAVSKVTQDFMGLQYYLSFALPVIRIRPFNHTGPGQSARFVVPAFASQIAAIEAGKREPVMKVGNLTAARDFSDVRDIVRGYYLAATVGEPGEVYNLASGRPRVVRDLLDMLLSHVDVGIRIEKDPGRYRPVDVPVVYGSFDKFRQKTGWAPQITFEQTLQDVLDYWRLQVAQGLFS